MRFSRSAGIFVSVGCMLSMVFAVYPLEAQTPARSSASEQTSSADPALLPQAFGGWMMQSSPQISRDPAVADSANAAVLKEYRFSDFASATYTREDGRTLKIRAARFADASGAFGAYTFLLQPEMNKEQIGDQAASAGNRVLFYRGHVLVDAVFSEGSAMSLAQLRELAGLLPRPSGSNASLPTFIEFLPHRGYIANTQKYAMGPAALNALSTPVSADLVDFGASPEVTLAHYDTSSGEATLMLISYPTPQLAADHLRRLDAAQNLGPSQAGVSETRVVGPLVYKKSGPLLAIVTGPASTSDAKSLVGLVNYEASVTWNTEAESTQVRDLYKLLLNIALLCAILAGLAIIAGVAFGGIRILMKRLFPDKVFDRPEQMEFISLRLTETVVKGTPQSGSESGHGAP